MPRPTNIPPVDHDQDEKTSPSMSPLKQALRRVDKLQAILEVAKAMAAAHSLDALLPLILREAARVVEADRCSLFILDRQRNE